MSTYENEVNKISNDRIEELNQTTDIALHLFDSYKLINDVLALITKTLICDS